MSKPTGGKPGRPTKFTPETAERILRAVRGGSYRVAACEYAGIHRSTLHLWRKRADDHPKGPEARFFDALLEAERSVEILAANSILKAGEKDWKAFAWWLERKAHARWGRKDAIQVGTAPGTAAFEMQVKVVGGRDSAPEDA